MIDEPEERLRTYLNATAVQQDIDWYKVNTEKFNTET
jgi:hypothetical protein